jgi:hypothetical protein
LSTTLNTSNQSPPSSTQAAVQKAPQSLSSKRSAWKSIVTSMAALVVTVLTVEAIFAWAGIGETEYLRPDPTTGFEGIPHKSVTWRTEGFGRFRFNSIGAQDVEHSIAKPANTTRVAFLGDSFVEALQVDRSSNMCGQIEQTLNKISTKPVEMFNFGVSSANLSQCYLRLKHRVLPYKPDLVIVGVRVDAAIHLAPEAGAGFLYAARPTFSLDEHGNLVEDHSTQKAWMESREGKRMRATQWLRSNSRIWGVIGIAVQEFTAWWKQVKHGTAHWGAEVEEKTTAFTPANAPAVKWASAGAVKAASAAGVSGAPAAAVKAAFAAAVNAAPAAAVNAAPAPAPTSVNPGAYAELFARKKRLDDATTRKMWPLADALIGAMQKECAEHGCKLVLVRFCAAGHATNDVETALLKETSAKHVIPMFDCGPTFDKAFAANEPIFFQGHFTPLGHQIFANAFCDFLRSNSKQVGLPLR